MFRKRGMQHARGLADPGRPRPQAAGTGEGHVFIAGGFERKMPAIVEWFAKDR
jgi:hypothetical protein